MKFRAVFKDPHTLLELCESIQRIQKLTLIKLSASKVRLAAMRTALDADEDPGNAHARVWVSIPTTTLFSAIQITSKRENEIYCLVKTADLAAALRQCSAMRSLQPTADQPLSVKLSKDGAQPILVFASSVQDELTGSSITHSIPAQVIGDEGPELAQMPSLAECVLTLAVPPVDVLAAFCASCQHVEEPAGERRAAHHAGATVVLKVESSECSAAHRSVSLFCTHESSSLKCTFERVAVLTGAQEGTEDEATPEAASGAALYFTMKPSRLGAVLRAIAKGKRVAAEQSAMHFTEASGVLCSMRLAGDISVLFHVPCAPMGSV